jgi:hypothetical protein
MKKRLCLPRSTQRFVVAAHSLGVMLVLAGMTPSANSQTPPPVSEEQRRRAAEDAAQQEQLRRNQTETLQRQQQLQAPNVDLQPPPAHCSIH